MAYWSHCPFGAPPRAGLSYKLTSSANPPQFNALLCEPKYMPEGGGYTSYVDCVSEPRYPTDWYEATRHSTIVVDNNGAAFSTDPFEANDAARGATLKRGQCSFHPSGGNLQYPQRVNSGPNTCCQVIPVPGNSDTWIYNIKYPCSSEEDLR